MDKQIKLLVMTNNQILISEIEEVGSEIGEPGAVSTIDPAKLKYE